MLPATHNHNAYQPYNPLTRRSTEPVPPAANMSSLLAAQHFEYYSTAHNNQRHPEQPVYPTQAAYAAPHYPHPHSQQTPYSAPPSQIQYAMGNMYYQTSTAEHVPTQLFAHSGHTIPQATRTYGPPLDFAGNWSGCSSASYDAATGTPSSQSSASQSPTEYTHGTYQNEIPNHRGSHPYTDSSSSIHSADAPFSSTVALDSSTRPGLHHHSQSFNTVGDHVSNSASSPYALQSHTSSARSTRQRSTGRSPTTTYSPYGNPHATSSSPALGRTIDQSKPHICDICQTGFQRGHDLKRHKETHSESKAHECECGKKFSRKDALRRHVFLKSCGKSPKPENDERGRV